MEIESYQKMYWLIIFVTVASKETECADRIVYETEIYKDDVVSARARKCFFLYIEVERLP